MGSEPNAGGQPAQIWSDTPEASRNWSSQMRETLVRHFDVVVVIWVMALTFGWSIAWVGAAGAAGAGTRWSAPPAHGPVWVVTPPAE